MEYYYYRIFVIVFRIRIIFSPLCIQFKKVEMQFSDFVFIAETVTVYLNGSSGEVEIIQTDVIHLSNLTENNLYVGRNNNSYFSGFIDEVK